MHEWDQLTGEPLAGFEATCAHCGVKLVLYGDAPSEGPFWAATAAPYLFCPEGPVRDDKQHWHAPSVSSLVADLVEMETGL